LDSAAAAIKAFPAKPTAPAAPEPKARYPILRRRRE
jgi:hypothetical protein